SAPDQLQIWARRPRVTSPNVSWMAVGVDIRTFREAVERDGHRPIVDAMAADVVFHTPVASAPVEGRAIVEWVLTAVFHTYDGFDETEQFETAGQVAWLVRGWVGRL